MTEKVWLVRPNEPTRAGEHTIVLYPPTDTLVLSFTVSNNYVLAMNIPSNLMLTLRCTAYGSFLLISTLSDTKRR